MSSVFYYKLYTGICRVVLSIFTRVRCRGMKELPPGPYILAVNHISHFDPPVIGGYARPKLDFMAMKDLFINPIAAWIFRSADVFPVDRANVDTQTVRTTLQRLKAGRIVCMYPEGGIRSGTESVLLGHELPKGAATMAVMAKVPVRPCMLVGTDQLYAWKNWLRQPRIFVTVGAELYADAQLSRGEAVDDLNRRIMISLRAMYAELNQQPEFSERLAPHSAQERWAGK